MNLYKRFLFGIFIFFSFFLTVSSASATVAVSVNASPYQVNYGTQGPVMGSKISWSSSGATSCILPDGTTAATSGSVTVSNLTTSTDYPIVCTNGVVGCSLDSSFISGGAYTNSSGSPITYSSLLSECKLPTNPNACASIKAHQGADPLEPACDWTGDYGKGSATVTVLPPVLSVGVTANNTANQINISSGATALINWVSTLADSCTSTGGGGTGTSGSFTTPALTSNTTYSVTCTKQATVGTCASDWGIFTEMYSINGIPTTDEGNAPSFCGKFTSQPTCAAAVASPGGADPVQNACVWVPGGTTITPVTGSVKVVITPTVMLSSAVSSVSYNDSTSLTLTSTNATTCNNTLNSNDHTTYWTYKSTGNLTSTKSWSATCTNSGGTSPVTSAPASVTVTVIPPSGTISADSSCTIPIGSSTCPVKVTWSTAGVDTTNSANTFEVTKNNLVGTQTPHVSFATSGTNVSNTINYGTTTFYLYYSSVGYSATQLASTTLAPSIASCTAGSTWNGTICAATPNPSGNLSATSCTVAVGGSSCNSAVTWSTANLVSGNSLAVTRDNPANTIITSSIVPAGTSGTINNAIKPGTYNYYLYYNNGTQLAGPAPVTASCISGTIWNGTICLKTIPPPTFGYNCGDCGTLVSGGIYSTSSACTTACTTPTLGYDCGACGTLVSGGTYSTSSACTATCPKHPNYVEN